MMKQLNLPVYDFRYRTTGQSKEIFDSLRKKFVRLTPEEWVRQHFVMYLTSELKYPSGLVSIETGIMVNGLQKRSDIVVYDRNGQPWMIVECKRPEVTLNEETFYQAANYHQTLNSQYLVVTNGIQHYCCKFAEQGFQFINSFPEFEK